MELGASAATRAGRRGFTFIEVMFAVLILAFGVIMIAAMLPVALRETQRTRDTNAGSSSIEGGFHMEEMAWATALPAERAVTIGTPPPTMPATFDRDTGLVAPVTFPAYGWNYALPAQYTDVDWSFLQFWRTLGNRIDTIEGAYAYIPFYARNGSAQPQLAMVAVDVRNIESMRTTQPPTAQNMFLQGSAFFGYPDGTGQFLISDNCPLLVDIEFDLSAAVSSDGSGVDKIEPDMITMSVPAIDGSAEPLPGDHMDRLVSAAVKDAALVLINDNGDLRILRLGERIDGTADQWTLAPGGDTQITRPPALAAGAAIGPAEHLFQEFNDKDATGGTPTPQTAYRGYLIGRMVENPGAAWDADDNPYVGPSQVVQVLEGRNLP